MKSLYDKVIHTKERPVRVIPDSKYPDKMYRLQWKNGDLSADMYNLSRANDLLRHYKIYYQDYQASLELSTTRSERMKAYNAENHPYLMTVRGSQGRFSKHTLV